MDSILDKDFIVKVRSMDKGTPARVVLDPLPHIVFLADVKGGVAPGQSAVVYDGDDVVMAGFIKLTHNK